MECSLKIHIQIPETVLKYSMLVQIKKKYYAQYSIVSKAKYKILKKKNYKQIKTNKKRINYKLIQIHCSHVGAIMLFRTDYTRRS